MLTIAFYALIRVDHASSIVEPKIYPDSKVYLSVANSPITAENYWLARVPVVIPLVYKLFGGNTDSIIHFQIGFSLFSWVVLGLSISNSFDGRILKYFAFFSILLFSLSGEILLYDFLILSESISLSLMIIHISAWIIFIENRMDDWRSTVLVIISGVLWIFTRDTNSLFILGLSLLILIYSLLRKSNLNLKIISFVLIGMCFLSSNSGSASERWIPPNIKVIEQRILTDNSNLAFYEANGMPVSEKLMEFAGRKEGGVFEWFGTPELAEFIQWHNENGKRVYLKYLLSDPIKLFFDPFKNIRFLVNSNPIFYYSPRGFEQIFPQGLGEIIFIKLLDRKSFIFSLVIFLVGFGIYILKKKEHFVTPLILAVLLYPHALIVWTASGGDVNRHAFQFRVQFRLTIILLFIFILGYFVERIVSKYFSFFERGKKLILILGIGFAVFALIADFLFETRDTFSLGYSQIFLLSMGGLLIVGSGYLHFAPEKLRYLLIGNA